MRALFVYPTHENCAEIVTEAEALGLNAVSFPGRFTEGEQINCWNPDADAAERIGFPVVKTVCPSCPRRTDCGEFGYLAQMIAVRKADIAACTHKRIEYSGFRELCASRMYVSVHEDAISILRPECGCSRFDLLLVQNCFNRLLNDPKHLNWFGDDLKVDDNGEPFHDEELAIRKDRLYQFCVHTAEMVDDLLVKIDSADKITEWTIPSSHVRPQGIERLLFRIGRELELRFDGQPWRFILAAASGELQSAAIVVYSPSVGKKESGNSLPTKSVVGHRQNPPAAYCITWFNDATTSADRLSSLLSMPVEDKTPQGQIKLQKKAVQVIRDITRKTSERSLASIVRGILTDRPEFRRVGFIGHRPHLKVVKNLQPEFARRIVKTTYFGSGEDRSSNAWHVECDLIIIAGRHDTPPIDGRGTASREIEADAEEAASEGPAFGQ